LNAPKEMSFPLLKLSTISWPSVKEFSGFPNVGEFAFETSMSMVRYGKWSNRFGVCAYYDEKYKISLGGSTL
jgi:hypothetical protein